MRGHRLLPAGRFNVKPELNLSRRSVSLLDDDLAVIILFFSVGASNALIASSLARLRYCRARSLTEVWTGWLMRISEDAWARVRVVDGALSGVSSGRVRPARASWGGVSVGRVFGGNEAHPPR